MNTRLCKKCLKVKPIDEFPKHRHACKVCQQKLWKYYYDNDSKFRSDILARNKAKRNKIQRNQYETLRRHNDVGYRLRVNLRNRISEILHNKQRDKSINLLGCTLDELKSHLESKFQPGMTWENYGYTGWHVDHIIPCAAFDLTKPAEQAKCFHYSNLQPLWATDNYRKSNKII